MIAAVFSQSVLSTTRGGVLERVASFIPELILELTEAVRAGDLKRAMSCQARINPLKDVVYGMGEPTGDAHARMKLAIVLAGRLKSAALRPPTQQPDEETRSKIAAALASVGMLQKQAAWLQRFPTVVLTIEGHADERGTREYNLALGARRAAATRDFLISKGVAGNRMKTISYGKERPVAVCDDISCWSQNRRAVTVLNGAGS